MVLDPLSALGVAGNVVQFVEFGWKLVAESREIYHSVEGLSGDFVDMELVVTTLRALSYNLGRTPLATDIISNKQRLSPSTNDSISAKKDVEVWRELAGACYETAGELLDMVHGLKVTNGPQKRWRSFQQALKAAWKKEQIKKLHDRLEGFRKTITTQLISTLR